MKKLLSAIVMLVASSFTFGQVGINTASPESTLDIRAKNHLGTVSPTDGVLVPRVNDLSVNGSVNGQLVYLISDTGSFTKGFYYWNGTVWTGFGGASGDNTNDAWINDSSNVMVKLGTQSDGTTTRIAGTDFVAKDNGAVGIGTASPNASAILDISATNKGVLVPRVALANSTDQVTIPSPATGLLAYNTGVAGLNYNGYVYWNGFEWRSFDDKSIVNPTITGLTCSAASIFPSGFTSGVSYSGTLTVPYTGGNGGKYNSSATFTQNGLTFSLNPGNLNSGNGSITYSVNGTPNFTSPNTISVPINFLGQSCNAIIGQNSSLASLQYVRNVISPIDTDTPTNSITTIGNLSIRYNGTTATTANLQYRINGINQRTSVWYWKGGTGGSWFTYYAQNDLNADTWKDFPSNFNVGNRDSAQATISLFDNKQVYRITVVANPNLTANGAFPALQSSITIFVELLSAQ
ncbi:hypothetical protein CLU97_1284 [Chryseobacterium sp. 7]|uniref:hypothetical protein n=1 Tax=Chryseobacterium sp. 7 TaxID=2035214 RepID=UPI000EB3434E|nr:hypothetical protein [Chryseobacterium sp. 7]RLJ31843.1 hypothetical protein CLU97_1284 [Chryseobacterium sp. 7]